VRAWCHEKGKSKMTTTTNYYFLSVYKLRRIVLLIQKMFQIRRSRNSLIGLSDDMLKDIGITREMAMREGRRPTWDVSQRWM
jgi:uncharacterized protein YjiS (DUF1127 family)